MTKYAFLDFDGALSKGYIAEGALQYFSDLGLYSKECGKKQEELHNAYRQGRLSYHDLLLRSGKVWALGFEGTKTCSLKRAAEKHFEKARRNIYPSTYKLIGLLKRNGFTPVIVSASGYELMALAARALKIKKVFATKTKTIDGRYRNRLTTSLHVKDGKKRAMHAVASKEELARSFAFGDSITDVEMLESVGRPVALNPTPELETEAKRRKWATASSKNVISIVKKML